MAHTRLKEFSVLSPLSLGSVSKVLRRKQAWVVEDKRWKRTHSVSLMPHALRLRQAPQATESAPEETTELSLFPRSAPEASLFSLVTSQGSQRGTLHPYLCLRALVLIHRLPRLALICTLTQTPLSLVVPSLGQVSTSRMTSTHTQEPRGPATRHLSSLPTVGKVHSQNASFARGCCPRTAGRRNPSSPTRRSPCIPLRLYWGLSTGQGLLWAVEALAG